jgi:hypothetical protein
MRQLREDSLIKWHSLRRSDIKCDQQLCGAGSTQVETQPRLQQQNRQPHQVKQGGIRQRSVLAGSWQEVV